VWLIEEAETWNQIPLCAECIENTKQKTARKARKS